jgi:hypothetical protein
LKFAPIASLIYFLAALGSPQTSLALTLKNCNPQTLPQGLTPADYSNYLNQIFKAQKDFLKNPKETVDQSVIDTSYPIGRQRLINPLIPGTRNFAVIADHFSRTEPEEIVLPAAAIVCLLKFSNTLLLSDGTTKHYVSVDRVDLDKGQINILDGWPRRSFLIGDDLKSRDRGKLLQQAGGGLIIEAPIETVSSFLIGAIFDETPDFVDRVRQIVQIDTDPGNLQAIGLTLFLDDEPDTFDLALDYVTRSVAVANSLGDKSAERSAYHELGYLLLKTTLTDGSQLSKEKAASYVDRYKQINKDGFFSPKGMTAWRLVELGNLFMERPRLIPDAYNFAFWAIEKDSSRADAFLLGARAARGFGLYDSVGKLASEAYRLNTERIRTIMKTQGKAFLDEYYKWHGNISMVKEINAERFKIMWLLSEVDAHDGKFADMLELGEELEKLFPLDWSGAVTRAKAEFGLGQKSTAGLLAQEALKRGKRQGTESIVRKQLEMIFNCDTCFSAHTQK